MELSRFFRLAIKIKSTVKQPNMTLACEEEGRGMDHTKVSYTPKKSVCGPNFKNPIKKIPHTGDKESLDRCG